MPISQEDKQKYIDYLKSRGKDLPASLQEEMVAIDFSVDQDPIYSVADGIEKSLKEAKPDDYAFIVDLGVEEYRKELYKYLLSSALDEVMAVEEGYYDDKEFFEEAEEIESVEEFFVFILIKSSLDEKVAENSTKGLFKGYYEYCEQRELPTDNRFKEIVSK